MNANCGVEPLLTRVVPLFVGHQLRDAERPAAGDDRHLVDQIDVGQEPGEERVARLVIGGDFLFLRR